MEHLMFTQISYTPALFFGKTPKFLEMLPMYRVSEKTRYFPCHWGK